MDWVGNIPGFLLILNSLFMVALKTDREKVNETFESMLRYAGYEQLQLKQKQEKLRRQAYHQKKYFADPSIKEAMEKQLNNSNDVDKDSGESSGIFAKFHKLKAGYTQTKIKLSEIQTRLGDAKIKLGKMRSIYKWNIQEQSKIVCVASCIVGLCLYFIPLRWTFVAAGFIYLFIFFPQKKNKQLCLFCIKLVCGVFWKHSPFNAKNKDKRSPIDIFIDSIPADIPDVEDEEKEKDSGNSSEKDGDSSRSKPFQKLGEHLKNRGLTVNT
ncbi:hypothetical protein RFI_19023 [Reticulomyxa filosa]|uniref:Uncharacterized protein n=1 Tax=Reticulomyxa filosa TaxID=46433 RepID=X6MWN4_RETFI|nr:hypothetical protein RFI_19023 [Reticulomyxa filosa]|eukprot:ETO18254.1 hypothetical protein RFI_19023 [Reticulomyxa filosa]